MKSAVLLSLALAQLGSFVSADSGVFEVSVSLISRTTFQLDTNIGCTCDEDCGAGYICKDNCCVEISAQPTTPCTTTSPTMVAPTSRTTQQVNVECTCDADCTTGYICENNGCVKKSPITMTTTTTMPCTTSSSTIAPTSRTTQQVNVGCTCDEDCGTGYVCENNCCVKILPTSTAPCTTTTPPCTTSSVTVAPTSRTTQQQNMGCTCDDDCAAGYVCEDNCCVKKMTLAPTSQPASTPCSTSTSPTVAPTSRTTQQHNVGCSCDEDCGSGYVCEHNICVKVLPTSQPTTPCETPTTPCETTPTYTILPTSHTPECSTTPTYTILPTSHTPSTPCETTTPTYTILPTSRTASSECTTTPTYTILPTSRTTTSSCTTTMMTSTTSSSTISGTVLPTFVSGAEKNMVGWILGMVGVVGVFLW